jgi:hypothetical protein
VSQDWAVLVQKDGGSPPPDADEPLARYFLVDADTDEKLIELVDGRVVDPVLIDERNLTIVAEANASNTAAAEIESVRMTFDDGALTHVESHEPYAMFGDDDGDLTGGLDLTEQHSVTFDFYDADGAQGAQLGTESVSFSIGTEPPPPPVKQGLGNYYLADATTDQILVELAQGAIVDAALLTGRSLTIVAHANLENTAANSVESVRLDLDQGVVTRTENTEPYALFGDREGDLRGGLSLDGSHRIACDFYDADDAKGTLIVSESLEFFVV